jgi:hypothetical protein
MQYCVICAGDCEGYELVGTIVWLTHPELSKAGLNYTNSLVDDSPKSLSALAERDRLGISTSALP